MDRFVAGCLELGDKRGGLLVQLPPSLELNATRANTFFAMLRRRLPPGTGIACEPRHPTWFRNQSLAIMRRHEVTLIAANPASRGQPELVTLPRESGVWRYWRLHRSPRIYSSAYSFDYLAKLLPLLLRASAEAWVIFDNTAQGHAVANALALRSLVTKAAHMER